MTNHELVAVVLSVGLPMIALLWRADVLADRARLLAAPDLTGRLSELYQRPAMTRRRT